MSSFKIVLCFGIFLTCLMCLYPPYRCVGISADGEIPLEEGYYSVFSPHQDQHYNTGRSKYTVAYTTDFDLLYGQGIFIGIISGGLATILYTIRRDKQESNPESNQELSRETIQEKKQQGSRQTLTPTAVITSKLANQRSRSA